ncbi:MAG: hypothetical protein R2754_07990 [Microthrixaceae bacterium]
MTATDQTQDVASRSIVGDNWHQLFQPPRWLFHATLVFVGALAFWSASYPGGTVLGVMVIPALGIMVVVWMVRVAVYLWARRTTAGLASARWLVAAPLVGLAVLCLLAVQAPLQVRFALSRSAFERVADRAQPNVAPNVTAELEVGGRLGWYSPGRSFQQGDATIVYVNGANFIDDGGFAHLPDGPFPGLGTAGGMEHPVFTHLTGDWYIWTASW